MLLKLPDLVHKHMKKLDAVGLDFAITKQEALEALIHENPGLGLSPSKVDSLSAVVETNPDLFISVFVHRENMDQQSDKLTDILKDKLQIFGYKLTRMIRATGTMKLRLK